MLVLKSIFRILCPFFSAANKFPTVSPHNAQGLSIAAAVAGPVLPLDCASPVPATLVMIPDVSIFRMECESPSPTKMFPAVSPHSPHGASKEASMAGPKFPLAWVPPSPAKVSMMPVALVILRTLRLSLSVKYMASPALSAQSSRGKSMRARLAAPPSPEKPSTPSPPAKV